MGIACLFGHKWDGCRCARCGLQRNEGHDWDLCKGVCLKCGAKQPPQHDWDGKVCRRCGLMRVVAPPKNLVVFAPAVVEGEKTEGDDALITSAALSLVNRATQEQFMLNPRFQKLYAKYASLKLVDQMIPGGGMEEIEEWLSKETGNSIDEIHSNESIRYFHMRGTDYVRSGLRIRFYVASYFYNP